MTWSMYLDDIRTPKKNTYDEICLSFDEAISVVEHRGSLPSFISFDHDLGIEKYHNNINDNSSLAKTGYDFAKWIVEQVLSEKYELPINFSFHVHSANPVGKKNIETLLTNFLKHYDRDYVLKE